MKRPKNFRGNTDHSSTPARGGSVTRRYTRGNLSAARATHKPRRHGAHASSNGLGMRPPGCGVVDYQDPNGKHAPRVYTGSVEDAPPDLLVADEQHPLEVSP